MTNKRSPNDVNEELPDEHEVIQHSLRESSDKPQRDKAPVKKHTGVQKSDGSRPHKANSSSTGEAKKNKRH
jgi:hypothetical protein